MKSGCISIIIPTYNSSLTIVSGIKSIIDQTFTDFEILLIDGASTDNTVNIAKSFNDIRIKIYSEPDKGIYDAMNRGISLSKGNWLYFMGSDDTLYNNNVLKDVDNNLTVSSCKILYGNVLVNGNTAWAIDNQVYAGEFTIGKLFKQNIAHQAIFYHRSVFDKIGNYNILYKVCADYDLNLRIASRFKLQYTNLIIANFYAGGMSTHSEDKAFFLNFDETVFKYYKSKLLAPYMAPFGNAMIQQAKKKFKTANYFDSLYFLLIGSYHKINNKIKS